MGQTTVSDTKFRRNSNAVSSVTGCAGSEWRGSMDDVESDLFDGLDQRNVFAQDVIHELVYFHAF